MAGAGAVGLSAVMAAALTPALRIVAVDVVPQRLDLARKLGATHAVDATTEDLPARIAEITDGAGCDGFIETTGNVAVLRQGVDALAARGTAVVIGAPPFGTEVSLDVNGMLGGKTVVGVTLGDSETQSLIPILASMVADGRLPVSELISTYDFTDIQDAVSDVRAAGRSSRCWSSATDAPRPPDLQVQNRQEHHEHLRQGRRRHRRRTRARTRLRQGARRLRRGRGGERPEPGDGRRRRRGHHGRGRPSRRGGRAGRVERQPSSSCRAPWRSSAGST